MDKDQEQYQGIFYKASLISSKKSAADIETEEREARRIKNNKKNKLRIGDLESAFKQVQVEKEARKQSGVSQCVNCNSSCDINSSFADELSKKEYLISGLCQICQDRFFGPPVKKMSQDYKKKN